MEYVYIYFKKNVSNKVQEFSLLLLQFQENFPDADIKKIIDKKNELITFCTNYVYMEHPAAFGKNTFKSNVADLETFVANAQSMKYMYEKTKELDKLFLEFLIKFSDCHLSK